MMVNAQEGETILVYSYSPHDLLARNSEEKSGSSSRVLSVGNREGLALITDPQGVLRTLAAI